MTPPNALVALRVLLAIPIAALAVPQGHVVANAYTALLLFVLAVGTDVLDGALARRLRSTSALGGLMDTVADKILVLAVLLPIAAREPRVVPVIVLLVARDIFVTVLRYRRPTSATALAKVKTALLYAACAAYLFAYAGLPPRDHPLLSMAYGVLLVGLAAAMLSAAHYLSGALSRAPR